MAESGWSGVDSEILQQRFRDALTFFWIEASRDNAAAYEASLAEGLQRLFPGAWICVMTCNIDEIGRRDPIGGGFSELDAKGVLDVNAMTCLIREHIQNRRRVICRKHQQLRIELRQDIEMSLSLGLCSGREEFWILVKNSSSLADVRAASQWLTAYVSGQRELHAGMATLALVRQHERRIAQVQALENSSRLASFRHQVLRLSLSSVESLSVRLTEAREIISGLSRIDSPVWQEEAIRILGELGLWMIQEMLGPGGSARNAQHRNISLVFAALSQALETKLNEQSRNGKRYSSGRKNSRNSQLRAFRIIAAGRLAELEDLRKLLADPLHPEDPLFLLLLWSRWHEVSGSLEAANEGRSDLNMDWYRCLEASLPMINSLLEPGWIGDGARLNSLSAWLNLWLARRLMLHALDGDPWWNPQTIAPFHSWRLRSRLALVIRESLRLSEFGDRPEFTFHPTTYLHAMAHLVEQHAYHVVGVDSRYDLSKLLKAIGRGRNADDVTFAASHLQHVLQVYVLGHFLAELGINEEQSTETPLQHRQLKALLASKGAPKVSQATQKQFLKAFSLAALLHDIGILLFPHGVEPIAELVDFAAISKDISTLATNHSESAKELRRTCLKDLESSLKGEKDGLHAWLDEHGEVDHSLLGAWYLLRLKHVLPKDVLDADSEAIEQAACAVLLHPIFTKEVSIREDGVAALLVLCDEIFEWQPGKRRLETAFIDTSHGRAVELDVRPEGSRSARIVLHGLEARGTDSGEGPRALHWALRLFEEDRRRGWPRFELHLKEPDRRNQETWQIWMQMHQNLARLRAADGDLWNPSVEITSSVPGYLWNKNLDTKRLLDEWVDKSELDRRSDIANWLQNTPFSKEDSHPPEETMRITTGQTTIYSRDISLEFKRIRKELRRFQ